ncbi:MAG: histidine phosphatase family protein [Burkholderiales bacterium]
MTNFLLLRHGETLWNLEGRLQGWQDSPLSDAGRAQADALAARLAGERVDAIVTSDLGRTRDTAAPIAARLGLALQLDAGLRERCYGEFENMTWPEIERARPWDYQRLAARDPEYVVPGGESSVQFRDRVVSAFEHIARSHAGATVAVVTHGGVLGIVYRHANDIALEMPRTFSVPNAAVNRVRIDARRWAIEAWADTGHLAEGALDDE